MKKWIAILLLIGILCGLLAGCGKKITAEEAWQIAAADLGITAEQAGTPHVHEITYKNKPAYEISITADGTSWLYAVSQTGKILHKSIGVHSH